MKKKSVKIQFILILLSLFSVEILLAQSVSTAINEVNTGSLNLYLNEFTGEVSTRVDGRSVRIRNRVSSTATGNDLAADYLVERFKSFGNLTVDADLYSRRGRNVVATQLGQTNPNDVYIICGHYDSVTNYCADDNATSTSAILEIARVLSKYCTDNTIVYALWDEEEIGLRGSDNYARNAARNGDNILGVINMDMIGYDKNQNDDAAIHAMNFINSVNLQRRILNMLDTYSSEIGLTANPVNPGLGSSDHVSFINQGFPTILISEAAGFSDLTPYYHTSSDRVRNLDLPYFYKMSKLAMGAVATLAGINNSNSCNRSGRKVISNFEKDNAINIANSFNDSVNISLKNARNASVQILTMFGQLVKQQQLKDATTQVNLEGLSSGIYLMKVTSGGKTEIKKVIKE